MNAIVRVSFFAFALLGSSLEAQNLIVNGSFESPVIPSNTRQLGVPTSWTGGSFTVIVNGNGSVSALPFPQQGQQYVAVATSETLSQIFTVSNALQSPLQWFDSTAHEPGITSAPYSVEVLSGTSQVVASTSLNAYHPEDWVQRSLDLNLSSGNYTLRFIVAGGGPGGISPLFDNVRLVPEPCTIWAALAAGLIPFGHRVRRS